MDFDDLDDAEVENVKFEAEKQEEDFKEYYEALQPYYFAHQEECQPLRLGVLSTAGIIHTGIIGPCKKSPQAARIVGIASRSLEQAATVKGLVGEGLQEAQVFQNYQELLDDPSIECIYNPLPNGLHFEWTKKALEAGKHVLLEKPFTANSQEAKLLVDLAREKNLVLMEAAHWYYHPVRARLTSLIQSGVIGKVTEIDFHFRLKRVVPPVCLQRAGTFDTNSDSGKMWIMRRGMAGGLTMTLGTYDINIIRTMVGEEPNVTWSQGTCLADDDQMDVIMKAELYFPKSGVKAFFEAGGMGPEDHHNEMKITGTDGTIEVHELMEPQYLPNRIAVFDASGVELISKCESVSGCGHTTYDLQLLAFVDHIRQVRAGECAADSFPHTGEDNIRQMEVIDQVYGYAGMRPRWGQSGIVPSLKWEVCSSGSVAVHKAADKESKEVARLDATAVVEGVLQDHGWLQFKKISGPGPDSGWVNVRGKDAPALKPVPLNSAA